jgi:hypothetical protein
MLTEDTEVDGVSSNNHWGYRGRRRLVRQGNKQKKTHTNIHTCIYRHTCINWSVIGATEIDGPSSTKGTKPCFRIMTGSQDQVGYADVYTYVRVCVCMYLYHGQSQLVCSWCLKTVSEEECGRIQTDESPSKEQFFTTLTGLPGICKCGH